MNQTKEKKTSLSHKVLSVIGAVLCVILIPILVMNISLIIRSFTNPDEVPSIGGILPLIVLTDSMYPEIHSGDLIICHTEEPENVKAGDIIAFFDPTGNGTSVVTHRVMEVIETEDSVEWVTKGDANNTADAKPVPASKLVGVYQSRIPELGNVVMFMQTTTGLIVCVVCPILLLVGWDILRRKKYEKTQKADTDALLRELEELRAQKAKQEEAPEE